MRGKFRVALTIDAYILLAFKQAAQTLQHARRWQRHQAMKRQCHLQRALLRPYDTGQCHCVNSISEAINSDLRRNQVKYINTDQRTGIFILSGLVGIQLLKTCTQAGAHRTPPAQSPEMASLRPAGRDPPGRYAAGLRMSALSLLRRPGNKQDETIQLDLKSPLPATTASEARAVPSQPTKGQSAVTVNVTCFFPRAALAEHY